MTLDINYTTTNPRKVDQILENSVDQLASTKKTKVTWMPIMPQTHISSGTRTAHLLTSAPDDFIGLQVIFPNPGASVSVTRCAVAVTESKVSPIIPRINGVSYDSVAAADTQLGWVPVTFAGGAEAGVLPIGTMHQPSYLISDFIPISAIPRVDGGKFALLMCRAYWSVTAHPVRASFNLASAEAIDTVISPYTFQSYLQGSVDGVTTPSAFTSTTVNNNMLAVGFIYHTVSGKSTVVMAGDSIMAQGAQENTTDLQRAKQTVGGWPQNAVRKLSTTDFIGQIDLSIGGSTPLQYFTRLSDVLTAGIPVSLALYSPWSPNPAPGSGRAIESSWHRYAGEVMALERTYKFETICTTPTPSEIAPDAVRELARAKIKAYPTPYIDWNPILYNAAGAGNNKWVEAYRFDTVHPNEAGSEAMATYAAPIIKPYVE